MVLYAIKKSKTFIYEKKHYVILAEAEISVKSVVYNNALYKSTDNGVFTFSGNYISKVTVEKAVEKEVTYVYNISSNNRK